MPPVPPQLASRENRPAITTVGDAAKEKLVHPPSPRIDACVNTVIAAEAGLHVLLEGPCGFVGMLYKA